MYTFFTVFGFIFIATATIAIDYIYKIFSINKITDFLYPTDGRNVLNEINLTVLPTIVWGFIELPVLGVNHNFIFSIILNIIISCSIMYEIKYGISLILNKDNKIIDVLGIVLASFLGQVVSYMILKSKPILNIESGIFWISLLGIIILLIIHCIIIFNMPKLNIKQEIKYEDKRDR